jgi:hypothetical protein
MEIWEISKNEYAIDIENNWVIINRNPNTKELCRVVDKIDKSRTTKKEILMDDNIYEKALELVIAANANNSYNILKNADFKSILSPKYVASDEIANFFQTCFVNRMNGIVWGPGGFGKSNMIKDIITELKLKDKTFITSFGEGTTEASLWGDYDFEALNNDGKVLFNVENSFLKYPIVIFEELLDAPPSVLTALKNTLQERELQKGTQTCKMETIAIIALTNKDPAQIGKLGAHVDALMERFPLQLNHKWDSVNSSMYNELFIKRFGNVSKHLQIYNNLADLFTKLNDRGTTVSPRIALSATEVVLNEANLDSFRNSWEKYVAKLKFVKGIGSIGNDLINDITKLQKVKDFKKQIRSIEEEIQHTKSNTLSALKNNSPAKMLEGIKSIQNLQNVTKNLVTDDETYNIRENLLCNIEEILNDLCKKYFNAV